MFLLPGDLFTQQNQEVGFYAGTDQKTPRSVPRCGIDSVIGSAAGFPLTKEFLFQMHARWF